MDAVAELGHLRGSLINYVGSESETELQFFEGFTEYALEELEDVEKPLAELYKGCTGRELTKPRLR